MFVDSVLFSAPTPSSRMRGTCALLLLCAAFVQVQGTGPEEEMLPAEFQWAQRKDRILLTIELQVCKLRSLNREATASVYLSQIQTPHKCSRHPRPLKTVLKCCLVVPQGVHDEKFEVTSDGIFRFQGSGSYRDQRDHVGRYSVDLQVCVPWDSCSEQFCMASLYGYCCMGFHHCSPFLTAVGMQLLRGLNASDASCGGLCQNWRLRPREKTCKLAKDAPIWETCVLAAEVIAFVLFVLAGTSQCQHVRVV